MANNKQPEASNNQKPSEKETLQQEAQDVASDSGAADDVNNDTASTENQENEAPSVEGELKAAEEKYQALNDKYLRLYSDFENFRRRSAQEKLQLLDSAGADVMKLMLVVLDDFERAIKNNENATDIEGVKEGFQLIYNKLLSSLESKGLKPMNSQGDAFDTDLHEAITNIPAPSDELKGKVVDVAEKGYYLRDKVLRYAKVIIGQ